MWFFTFFSSLSAKICKTSLFLNESKANSHLAVVKERCEIKSYHCHKLTRKRTSIQSDMPNEYFESKQNHCWRSRLNTRDRSPKPHTVGQTEEDQLFNQRTHIELPGLCLITTNLPEPLGSNSPRSSVLIDCFACSTLRTAWRTPETHTRESVPSLWAPENRAHFPFARTPQRLLQPGFATTPNQTSWLFTSHHPTKHPSTTQTSWCLFRTAPCANTLHKNKRAFLQHFSLRAETVNGKSIDPKTRARQNTQRRQQKTTCKLDEITFATERSKLCWTDRRGKPHNITAAERSLHSSGRRDVSRCFYLENLKDREP